MRETVYNLVNTCQYFTFFFARTSTATGFYINCHRVLHQLPPGFTSTATGLHQLPPGRTSTATGNEGSTQVFQKSACKRTLTASL